MVYSLGRLKRNTFNFCAFALLAASICGCVHNDSSKSTKTAENAPLWYMNSVIYNVDVSVFKDSNGDGVGDFNGLTQELGYLKSLGVDMIWLSPFQPSPGRDDGYDITDYYQVDPKNGTRADFDHFMQQAKKLHLKVIMDLVLNHTSIEHPWFKRAEADTSSAYFNWYVWKKKQPKDYNKGMAFPGIQSETWTYDEVSKHYYFHRFYDFQPDLNYENLAVQKESLNIVSYWLKAGMDGFRLDAVPFILDQPEKGDAKGNEMFYILSNLEKETKKINPDAILLGEANVPPKESGEYFGQNGTRLQMMFNFYANQFLFYSLADGSTGKFKTALRETQNKPAQAQWAWFLRNHDEIDLGRLSSSERNEVYKVMGPEKNMQLYKRGIRRRLAPMVGNKNEIKFCYALLYSLPGAPVIRYGEELGMGEDLTLQERLSVRTPMQWSDTLNAGFTTAKQAFRAVISSGDYSYKKVNEAAEEKDPNSLLNFIKNIIAVRKQCPEIGLGKWQVLDTDNDKALAIKYEYKGKMLITVYNFSKEALSVTVKDTSTTNAKLTGLLNIKDSKSISDAKFKANLPAYGCQWYRVY